MVLGDIVVLAVLLVLVPQLTPAGWPAGHQPGRRRVQQLAVLHPARALLHEAVRITGAYMPWFCLFICLFSLSLE